MNMQAPRHVLTADVSPSGTPPGERRNLLAADWLYRSKVVSVLWLVARLQEFATAGVTGSTAGKGSGASYGWRAAFPHNFVLPNAGDASQQQFLWLDRPSRT
jgi:hypothetical protein